MKRSIFCKFFLLSLALAISVTGCKSLNKPVTPIPAGRKDVRNPDPNPPIGPGGGLGAGAGTTTGAGINDPNANGGGGIPLSGELDPELNMIKDAEIFKADTVYFEFDRATVKASEKTKLEHVGSALKGTPANKLLVEGHCDERGTEEYNRSLGERRALALREALISGGADGQRIVTRTYGKDRKVDTGASEAAHAKNRRGEFVVLRPK